VIPTPTTEELAPVPSLASSALPGISLGVEQRSGTQEGSPEHLCHEVRRPASSFPELETSRRKV
jgi:hypothetical protein